MCILAREEQELVLTSFKQDYASALVNYRKSSNKSKFSEAISRIFNEIKSVLNLDCFEDDIFYLLKRIHNLIEKKLARLKNSIKIRYNEACILSFYMATTINNQYHHTN